MNFNQMTAEEAVERVHEMHKAMIGHHNLGLKQEDKSESYEIRDVHIDDSKDALLFSGVPYSETELVQASVLNSAALDLMKKLFADVFSVKLTYDQKKGFYFVVAFNYMNDKSYNEVTKKEYTIDKTGEKFYLPSRAISSTVTTDRNTNSVALAIMNMVQHQQKSAYDASKYAKLTKDAKSFLTPMIMRVDNSKQKWVQNANYTLANHVGSSFNGQQFNNVIATVSLSAAKVVEVLCTTKEEAEKYEFIFPTAADNCINTDTLLKVERINVAIKKKLVRATGVEFR